MTLLDRNYQRPVVPYKTPKNSLEGNDPQKVFHLRYTATISLLNHLRVAGLLTPQMYQRTLTDRPENTFSSFQIKIIWITKKNDLYGIDYFDTTVTVIPHNRGDSQILGSSFGTTSSTIWIPKTRHGPVSDIQVFINKLLIQLDYKNIPVRPNYTV